MSNGMTIATHRPTINITFTLYGHVNEERAKRERALCDHRADQLSWTRSVPRERRLPSGVEMMVDYEACLRTR